MTASWRDPATDPIDRDLMLASLRPKALELLPTQEAEALLERLRVHLDDIIEPLAALYGSSSSRPLALLDRLLGLVVAAAADRPEALRLSDRRREIDPGWFQRPEMIGYVAYADRFAGDLRGVLGRLDYLEELGVSYLHLMPLLQARAGESDGGYAVSDYGRVEPALGTMDDLESLAGELHRRRMSLCVDLVVNHTASDHAWARAALAGDPVYRAYYRVFPDRTEPDAYELTLPEVFPDTAPGSFTAVPGLGYVWTTFNDYQWDLNWENPDVFAEVLGAVLHLGNRGVDVLRLDAVPFLWKRLGTDCQNQPEAHLIVQALRALVRVAMPGVIFKAEAIVAPEELVQYLGAHERYRPECDLAYHNQLMVMLWSSLATRDARLATNAITRLRPTPAAAGWITYLRCHDDIGWAISDADAAAVGVTGPGHRRFLNDFYAGRYPGSFARGIEFQADPGTGNARISGAAASLCGLEQALARDDEAGVEAGIRRLLLLYSMVYSFAGVPLIYMGDEVGLLNDVAWADDPSHASDNRWIHRPAMDWGAAARRHEAGALEARLFEGFRELGRARRALPALGAAGRTRPIETANAQVLGYLCDHARHAHVIVLANVSEDPQVVAGERLAGRGRLRVAHSSPGAVAVGDGAVLDPWGFVWLAAG